MAGATPTNAAQKWAQNLGAAGQRITDGVNSVTVSPGVAAAKQADLWLANLQASQAKWKQRVAAVTVQDWQSAMINKGVPRIATGATAAQPKFENFMGKLLPYIAQQKSQLPARGNLEQNIARMTAFVRGMSKFQNS